MSGTQSQPSLLERLFPAKRLFLRTDSDTRFVFLSPATQLIAVSGVVLVIGWTIVATAIFLMDSVSSGNFRDQAKRDQGIYEERLNAMSEERNARAAEASAAQQRFSTALEQVSMMQSKLLESEDRRRELERGIEVMQATLQRTAKERETALQDYASIKNQLSGESANGANGLSAEDMSQTLAFLSDTLDGTARERDKAADTALAAQKQYAEIDSALQKMEQRNDEIFRKLEDAMTISVKPLDRMFRNAGLNTNSLLKTVRRGYSGQGGALSPLRYSTGSIGDSAANAKRANDILSQLDRLNIYRIAAQKAPFGMPVRGNFRFTSGFGPRWGRMHSGTDFAAAHGTPIYSTADGVVTFAGWGSGYGRLIKIQHEFGIETRYAHLSRIRVKKGQRVSRGQRIGDMGNTGRSTGTHLHYEVRVGGKAVNPMVYIKAANDVF